MTLERLKQLRQDRDASCKEIADEIGISKEQYWLIENGRRRLTYDLAVKIASVFGKTPDEIFLPTELTNRQLTTESETE